MTSDEPVVLALTIRQPHAWAIFHLPPDLRKDTENRNWKPSRPVRLIVHAGKNIDPYGIERLHRLGVEPPPEALQGGYLIGRVDVLTWSYDDSQSWWAERACWHWHLTSPVAAITPIPARGMPAFFHPPENWADHFPPLNGHKPRRRLFRRS